MILLAKTLIGKKLPDQVTLSGMDTVVHRNFFGSQLGSFVSTVNLKGTIASFLRAQQQALNPEADKQAQESSERTLRSRGAFIRAPVVSEINSAEVEVLATLSKEEVLKTFGASGGADVQLEGSNSSHWLSKEGENFEEVVVAVKQNNFLATSFHPELTDETIWHQFFLALVKASQKTSVE